jgi:precorrin-8X/cobalt-precorrin-8 methylmutase
MRPADIERESFAIIERACDGHSFNSHEWAIVKRMIHATADLKLLQTVVLHSESVSSGISALLRGAYIICDTEMVRAGIASSSLEKLGSKVLCSIADGDIVEASARWGKTRAALSMEKLKAQIHEGIVAIGNAPTALFEIIRLAKEEAIEPALVIGVPVGFVGAAEAKDELLGLTTPYITIRGRKGGSPVAVSAVNALIHLALAARKDSEK